MKSFREDAIDDGFESCQEDKVDLGQPLFETPKQHQITVNEAMIKYIPPPQQIKDKPYSLHPDMLTGWMPKVSLPQPVPLTFPQDHVAQLLSAYSRTKPPHLKLIYLGPRFNNTFSAWKTYGVQFPYNHLGSQRVIITDRLFQGMVPFYPKSEVRFQSQFESGNLDAVFKVDKNEFDCFMRVDANTRGHLQWYYFKMFNVKKGQVYQINICNFQKAKSLYTRGMKPYIFSHRKNEDTEEGWQQQGQNIEYEKKRSRTHHALFGKEEEEEEDQKLFTLSFQIEPDYEDDIIEIAYCPPYTFTKLSNYLKKLVESHQDRNIIHTDSLCLSLSGFKVPLLTITNEAQQVQASFKQEKIYKDKHLIFVMSRIHPGESNGSYVMEGFLDWITGYSSQAEELRSKYLFKIVPMVNPDGVAIGNYRTGLSGRDFNRQFIDTDPNFFIQVDQLKKYLQRCKWIYQKGFNFFLDFHGHSVKKNAFAYGPQFPLTHSKYYQSRLLPKMISKRTQVFRYYSCVFKVSQYKASTARAIVLRQISIPFSYTIEASNGSYFDYEAKERRPFTVQKWLTLGVKICESLFDYWTVYKQIEEIHLRRKKERQSMLKSKGSANRKIHSSTFRSKTANFDKKIKISIKSGTHISQKKANNILNDILSEIAQQQVKQQDKCSDDLLSQGGSDSQASADDIDLSSVRAILKGKQDEKKGRVKRMKTKEEPKIQQREQKFRETAIRHSSSFLTDFEDESPQKTRRHPLVERQKKPHCVYRKIYTMSGSSVSPPPQASKRDSNGTAKIINLNFIMTPFPVQTSLAPRPQRRQPKAKTQANETQQSRPQLSQNTKRTYQSLQRQSIKKQLSKRMSVTSQNLTISQFKNQQVVGKRIFTQS